MDTHSFESGCSKRITLETSKLIMMDTAPNMPTVMGGSHVSAKKSIVEAANDKNIARTNSGRTKIDVLTGVGRLWRRVRGSMYSNS